MRRVLLGLAWAALGLSGLALASPSRVLVDSASGYRDSIATLPVRFQGDGDTLAFTAEISFSPTNLSLAAPPQAAGGASCTQIAPDRVQVSISSATPLPADVRYCDIALRVAATATGGVEPVTVATAMCTDSLGSTTACQTTNGSVQISGIETSLPDGFTLLIAGYESAGQETRRLRITNVSGAATTLSCDLSVTSDPALSIASAPPSIVDGATGEVIVQCALPPAGTPDRLGILTCQTQDTVRPTLRYNLICSTVPDGEPLPTDQLFDNQLKDGDQLGTSAAQGSSSNGEVLVLGAPFAGADSRGRILVYEGDTQISKTSAGGLLAEAERPMRLVAVLGPPIRKRASSKTTLPLDRFGIAVAITTTSQRLAVGAPNGGANGTGQVLVYSAPPAGWSDFNPTNPVPPPIVIDAPAAGGGLTPGDFGSEVTFAPNGDLLVGAPMTDVGTTADSGAVYRFKSTGPGFDPAPDTLTSVAPVDSGHFGDAVAMNEDRLIVGAPQEGSNGSQEGAAYVFPVVGNTFTAPQIIARIVQQANQRFGASVAIAGNTVIVGSPGTDTTAGDGSGAATVFTPQGDGTLQGRTVLVPAPGVAQGSGGAVTTNGDVIVVGAPDADDGAGVGQGVAYAYPVKPNYFAQEAPLQKLRSRGGRANDRFGRAVSAGRRQVVVGTPLRDITLMDDSELTNVGQADPFVLERVFKSGFENQ